MSATLPLSVQNDLVERALAAAAAHAEAADVPSPPRELVIEVVADDERDGVRQLQLVAHDFAYEYVPAGAQWATHWVLAGRARVAAGAVIEATFVVVHHARMTETHAAEYDADAHVEAVRRPPAPAAPPPAGKTLRCPECASTDVVRDADGFACRGCGHGEWIEYPGSGSSAAARWTSESGRGKGQTDRKMKNVFVDRENRWGLDVDEVSGRMFVNIPVANRMADYVEWYELDRQTFERFRADPQSAEAKTFVAKARNRELDHLLLLKPGTDRGWPI